MGTGDILLGVTVQMTSIPSRGSNNTLRLFYATETGISSGRVGLVPWPECDFILYPLSSIVSDFILIRLIR